MPWREADDPQAWHDLTVNEYNATWDAIYDRFAFRPSADPDMWPSFDEPLGSVTWGIESEFERALSDADYLAAERRVATALRDALIAVMGNDEFVYALDWQHPGYRFEPFKAALPSRTDSWLVPTLPNGDYFLFIARDLRFGWLSHPWESSVCVYGELIDPLQLAAEAFGWRILRRRLG